MQYNNTMLNDAMHAVINILITENFMDTIFKSIIDILKEKNLHIAAAESLTGGLFASHLVDVPGASKAFKEGFVTYCDEAKIHTLNVPSDVISVHGAISSQTAKFMAVGAAKKANTEIGISFTGNAGPDADEGKPVGLVFIGISVNSNTNAYECHFSGNRKEIRNQAAMKGAALLLESLNLL